KSATTWVDLLYNRIIDDDPRVQVEAMRAIHDEQLPQYAKVYEWLAKLSGRVDLPEAILWRALNTNFRLGKAEHAERVAQFAASPRAPAKLRIEAVAMLGDWAKPSGRDRILGDWRPLPERDPKIAIDAMR